MDIKILFISNQLSFTGAPLILLDTCKLCVKNGVKVELISMNEGPLRAEFEKISVNVEIWDSFIKNAEKFKGKLAERGYNLIFVNTLIPFEAIHILKNRNTPVIWWIHEGDEYFDLLYKVLPDFAALPSNITVLSVSSLVKNAIYRKYAINTDIFMLMVSETEKLKNEKILAENLNKKIRFLTVGAFSQVKGQDILLRAIQQLPENIKNNCFFTFVGRKDENFEIKKLFEKVKTDFGCVEEKFVDSREELMSIMENIDYVIVPSRWETVSMAGAESLMKSKPVIITETCGAAEFLTDMKDSFMIQPEEKSLASAIIRAVNVYDDNEEYKNMCKAARETYLKYFSVERFERELLNLIDKKVLKEKSVSVIIPCHNVAKWLPQCFLSLAKQSVGIENIELIFVDDASTDNGSTLALLTEIEKAYPENILVVSLNENLRQGGARNVALSYATGKYIAFVDSDDFVSEEFLKEVVDIAEKNNADIVQFGFFLYAESGGKLETCGKVEEECEVISIKTEDDRKKFLIEEKLNYGCCNKLYKREIIEKTGVKFAEKVIYEEPLFVYPLLFEVKKAVRLKKSYYYYRQNNSGTMWNDMKAEKTLYEHAKVQLLTLEFMKSTVHFEKFREEIKLYFLHTYLYETLLFAKNRGIKLKFKDFKPLIETAAAEFPDLNKSKYSDIIPKQMKLYTLIKQGITEGKFEEYQEDL